MIKKFWKISLSLVLLLSMSVSGSVFAQEDEYESISTQIDGVTEVMKSEMNYDTLANCEDQLAPLFDAKTVEFLAFLKRHYENKRFNSALNHAAVLKFSEYKSSIEEQIYELQMVYTNGGNEIGSNEYESFVMCSTLGETYISLAKQQLIDHAQRTSYNKKSTILVEKYKAINSQLRELLMDVSRMYANLETLKNKLPGFLSTCVVN